LRLPRSARTLEPPNHFIGLPGVPGGDLVGIADLARRRSRKVIGSNPLKTKGPVALEHLV
jgi:hypothetical protein